MGWVSVTVCVSVVLMLMVVVDIQLVSGALNFPPVQEIREQKKEEKVHALPPITEIKVEKTGSEPVPPTDEFWYKKGRKRRIAEPFQSDDDGRKRRAVEGFHWETEGRKRRAVEALSLRGGVKYYDDGRKRRAVEVFPRNVEEMKAQKRHRRAKESRFASSPLRKKRQGCTRCEDEDPVEDGKR